MGYVLKAPIINKKTVIISIGIANQSEIGVTNRSISVYPTNSNSPSINGGETVFCIQFTSRISIKNIKIGSLHGGGKNPDTPERMVKKIYTKFIRILACICIFTLLFLLFREGLSIGIQTPLPRDIGGRIIFLFFAALILLNVADLRDLIIPAKHKTFEKVLVAIGSGAILGIAATYGQTSLDYILGITGAMAFVLGMLKRGISPIGFNVIKGFNVKYMGAFWNNVKKIEITLQADVKVLITTGRYWPHYREIHYYNKEDYDRIITLLLEHVPREKVYINHQGSTP